MVKCGHCGEKHSTVNEVRHCAATADREEYTEDRQVLALRADVWKLLKTKAVERRYAQHLRRYLDADDEHVTLKGLQDAKERLMGMPSKATPDGKVRRTPVTTDGMYRDPEGTIWKVQHALHGGNLYAKKLVAEPATEGAANVYFVYTPGALSKLTAEDRMTVEEATAFGQLYGVCCVCGRTLNDEGSIAKGIGPVCEGKV